MFSRYVALGDSTTEGLDDPRPDGGYRGWADRLAEQLTAVNPELRYANLAVRGRRIPQVREEQLGPALALEPDLATVVAGLNDLLHRRYDPNMTAGHLEAMLRDLRGAGATVMTFTLPDLSSVVPLARIVRARLAGYNEAIRAAGEASGAIVVDIAAEPVSIDPRLWSRDRLHAGPLGHERIAAALAHTLGVDGADRSWAAPLPAAVRRPPHALVTAELIWVQRYFTPWLVRRIRGRSSGDGRTAKRPALAPIDH
ncbi:MAG TPA: SGNH/GDSL hydrolase family protein [Solirubrobacteraceae bacterium]